MKHIIENINRYKAKSVVPIKDQQIAYIPRVEKDQIDYTVPSYIVGGKVLPINQANQLAIKLKYLNFRHVHPKKLLKYQLGIFHFTDLINEKILYPFMLFVNGLFIPWELLDIAINNGNYFIIINAKSNSNFLESCRDPEYIQIVSLPEYVLYTNEYDANYLFAFNENGEFDNDSAVYFFVPSTTKNSIIYNYWNTSSAVNAYKIFDTTDIKLSEDNVFLFINKRLATGQKEKIKRAMDGNAKHPDGSVRPCIEFVYPDCEIVENPSIRFDSTLLTINDGKNENNDTYDFGVFVNSLNYTKSADNISKVSLDYITPIVQDYNNGNEVPEYFDDLKTPFSLKMDLNKDYNTNVAEAIKTIMKYNTSIFNPVFEKKSNLVIDEYNGEWVMANVRPDGALYIPRSHNTMIDEFIIMLVNGSLYKYFHASYYMNNYMVIPIQGIEYDDTVELLRFQNVNNSVMDIIVNESDGFIHSYDIINAGMSLYSTETNNPEAYEFPEDGLQHFQIGYRLQVDTNTELVKIILDDPFYYGKPLKLAYKNRFKHFTFHINGDSEYDEFVVNLKNKFMYCPEYSKYFVFYNGRRLFSSQYRLVLPVRPSTPFTEFKIYLTFPVSKGDKIDIIYVPSLMQDVLITNDTPIYGDVVIDKQAINYGLSTNLYMLWVNGKKIPASNIVDLNSTYLRIIKDQESTRNVCVTKYIPDIDVLVDVFNENEALWDKITKCLTNKELYKLLGISGEHLTNTESDIYEGTANIRSVMYELIRDEFMTNPRVDITNAFIYDYTDVDTSVINGVDNDGNVLIDAFDGNLNDNISGINRSEE